MRLSLITVKRRPDGDDVSRRATMIEGDALRVGRAASSDIHLPDVEVAYHHATLTRTAEGLILTGVGGETLMTDGGPMEAIVMSPGVSCRIGAYQLTAEEPGDGADHALAVQKIDQPAAASAGSMMSQTVAEALPSRRLMSWTLAIAVLAVFLMWPLASWMSRDIPPADAVVVHDVTAETQLTAGPPQQFNPVEAAWMTGPLSKAHASLSENCSACHQRAFEQVASNTCLSCHATLPQHAAVESHPALTLENAQCSDCHKEHEGGEAPKITAQAFCTECHQNIQAVSANSKLQTTIVDFGAQHPQFRPTLITAVMRSDDGQLEAQTLREYFKDGEALREPSNLKFPHDKHIGAVRRNIGLEGSEKITLECASCHVPEEDGRGMVKIEQEKNCAQCHSLKIRVTPTSEAVLLPHAKPVKVAEIVRGLFDEARDGGELRSVGLATSGRRRPGEAILEEKSEAAADWAEGRAEETLNNIFEVSGCSGCHYTSTAAETDNQGRKLWDVKPALLQYEWMPKAEFSHKAHEKQDCASCHAAETSKASTDVLMPTIAVCRDCHRGAAAGGPLKPKAVEAPSGCMTCHEYHMRGVQPMSPAHDAKARAMKQAAVDYLQETKVASSD